MGTSRPTGYRQEYQAWLSYAERIQAPLHTIPGNHDSRNVGYLHFEELIGARNWSVDVEGIRIVGVDSSEPDLNEGHGRAGATTRGSGSSSPSPPTSRSSSCITT